MYDRELIRIAGDLAASLRRHIPLLSTEHVYDLAHDIAMSIKERTSQFAELKCSQADAGRRDEPDLLRPACDASTASAVGLSAEPDSRQQTLPATVRPTCDTCKHDCTTICADCRDKSEFEPKA